VPGGSKDGPGRAKKFQGGASPLLPASGVANGGQLEARAPRRRP